MIDSGSRLIDPPLAGPGPSPVTLQYTGVRGHNGDNLVCQADQTQEAPDATETQTSLVLDIQCEYIICTMHNICTIFIII